MATTYSNAQLGIVDNSGNVKVVYPVTKATLVKMSTTRNSQTTVDGLLGTLGDCAYKNVSSIIDSGNTFDRTASYTSTTTTFNQKQIANLYSQLNSNTTYVASGDLIFTDNKGSISSSNGWNWKELVKSCRLGVVSNYIANGSYVNLTCGDNITYKMVAQVNTYKGNLGLGDHIDFISADLMGSLSIINDSNSSGSNNSKSAGVPSWISSKVGTNSIRSFLDNFYTNYIPSSLKPYIANKTAVVPIRYGSTNLSDDNTTAVCDLGKLWLLYAKEIWGDITTNISSGPLLYGPTGAASGEFIYEKNLNKYPAFNDSSFRIKKKGGSAGDWWTASDIGGSAYNFCNVDNYGSGDGIYPSYGSGVPLCFRIN